MQMLTPERLLRLMIEFIFIMLGLLVIWLSLAGRIYVDRHSTAWLILSVALILWGLRALYKPGQWWLRWENWTRGLSLALLGILMLVISRVPFHWVGPMLAAGGVLLVLRGVIGSALMLRPR
jgi:hypothetical protein